MHHRSVAIWLESQYALTISETLSPSSRKLLPISSRTITANIPTLPSSQFWICYRCPLPPPPKSEGDETRFYYFKLYVSGQNVLSWGVGEQEQWSGKTIFGLYDAGTDFEGRKVVEKRGFFFPEEGTMNEGDGLEIRVFRAKARKRQQLSYEVFSDVAANANMSNVTTIGRKKKGERQRRYTFALIDPTDMPYVTFRYVFRTNELLRQLRSKRSQEDLESTSAYASGDQVGSIDEFTDFLQPSPGPFQAISSPSASESGNMARLRRLSVPPRKPLKSSTSRFEPSSPVKNNVPCENESERGPLVRSQSASMVTARTNPERRHTQLRTPSPTHTNYTCLPQPGTPPSQRKKATGGLLRNVVASALKRKEKGLQQ